jgi:hypothetical protein
VAARARSLGLSASSSVSGLASLAVDAAAALDSAVDYLAAALAESDVPSTLRRMRVTGVRAEAKVEVGTRRFGESFRGVPVPGRRPRVGVGRPRLADAPGGGGGGAPGAAPGLLAARGRGAPRPGDCGGDPRAARRGRGRRVVFVDHLFRPPRPPRRVAGRGRREPASRHPRLCLRRRCRRRATGAGAGARPCRLCCASRSTTASRATSPAGPRTARPSARRGSRARLRLRGDAGGGLPAPLGLLAPPPGRGGGGYEEGARVGRHGRPWR